MRSTRKESQSGFEGVIRQISRLDLQDLDAIARTGVALEQTSGSLPQGMIELVALIDLCLLVLQAAYKKTMNLAPAIKATLVETVEAAEKALDEREATLQSSIIYDAAEKLTGALSGTAKLWILQFCPKTDDAAYRETFALDDIAALAMQIDPENENTIWQFQFALDLVICSPKFSKAAKKSIGKAIEIVKSFTNGGYQNEEGILATVSQCIEAAMEIEETSGSIDLDNATKNEAQCNPRAKKLKRSSPSLVPKDDVKQESANVLDATLPPDTDASLMKDFIAECFEYAESAEASLLALETNPENRDAIGTVFRAFHTIKGTSAFLGLTSISEFAHRAETLLSRIREGEIRCVGGYADLALRSVDMIKMLIQAVDSALSGNPMLKPPGYDGLFELLANPEAGDLTKKTKAAEQPSFSSIEPSLSTLVEEKSTETAGISLIETTAEQAPVGEDGGTANVVQNILEQSSPLETSAVAESSVRVHIDRLDHLIDFIGELVIAHSMVAQDDLVVGSNSEITKKVTHAGKIIRELQSLSMSMRMIPLKVTFQKLARVTRDLAHKSGKLINFVAEGEETEIDRNMVDLIKDPLVHMVRNAIDHGIEPPEERKRAGKPTTGTVRLTAFHSGGNIIVQVHDDGKGLDRERILCKALEKGLIKTEKGLSDNEIYSFIFAPGFSTAAQVTDVSGRGVGLDVVRTNIESLRGRIDIVSEAGKGSTFSLQMPLTLAITEGMLVKVGAERYILPTIKIQAAFKPETDMLFTVRNRGEMIMLRGDLVPMFRLYQLFEVPGAVTDPAKGLVLLLGDSNMRCALLIDELIGKQQVVAKSLGRGIGKVLGISGAAILGNGRVGLILDTAEIIRLAQQVPSVRVSTKSAA